MSNYEWSANLAGCGKELDADQPQQQYAETQ